MAWHLVERSNGQTLRGRYGSRDEAETFRAELVAEDAGYDDVLFIRWDGGDESGARAGARARASTPAEGRLVALWAKLILGAAAVFILLPTEVGVAPLDRRRRRHAHPRLRARGRLADLRQPHARDPRVVAVLRPGRRERAARTRAVGRDIAGCDGG